MTALCSTALKEEEILKKQEKKRELAILPVVLDQQQFQQTETVQSEALTARANEFIAAAQQCIQGHSQAQPDSAGDLYLKSCNIILLITSCYA